MRIKKKILQQIINCIFSHVRMHSSPCNMALSGQNKLRILDGDNNSGWNCECKYFHGVVCCCCCCWQWMCQSKAHEEEEEKSDVRAANSRSIRIEWHYDMFCFVCTYSISPRFRGFHVRTCRLTFSAFTWFLLTPRTYRKSGGVLHFSPLTKRFTLFIAECWAAFQCKQAIAIKITILVWANFSTAKNKTENNFSFYYLPTTFVWKKLARNEIECSTKQSCWFNLNEWRGFKRSSCLCNCFIDVKIWEKFWRKAANWHN